MAKSEYHSRVDTAWREESCQVIGDVDQAQRGLAGVIGRGHLGSQLCQHQFRGHAPFGMGGVAVGEQFHVSWCLAAECADFRAGLDLLLEDLAVPLPPLVDVPLAALGVDLVVEGLAARCADVLLADASAPAATGGWR